MVCGLSRCVLRMPPFAPHPCHPWLSPPSPAARVWSLGSCPRCSRWFSAGSFRFAGVACRACPLCPSRSPAPPAPQPLMVAVCTCRAQLRASGDSAPLGCLKCLRAAAATLWSGMPCCILHARLPAPLTPPGPSRGRAINITQHPAPRHRARPAAAAGDAPSPRVRPCCRPSCAAPCHCHPASAPIVCCVAPGLRVPRPSCAASRRPPRAP